MLALELVDPAFCWWWTPSAACGPGPMSEVVEEEGRGCAVALCCFVGVCRGEPFSGVLEKQPMEEPELSFSGARAKITDQLIKVNKRNKNQKISFLLYYY
jgi:hypothetical protein